MIIFRKQNPKTKIYMLRCESNFKIIDFPDYFIDFMVDHLREKAVKSLNNKRLGWVEKEDEVIDYDSAPISDCPFYNGDLPIFLNKKFKLPTRDCVTSKFDVDGEKYIMVLAPEVEGVLNIKSSKIKRFADGGIKYVENFVFNRLPEYPKLFRIKECCSLFTFCTEDVKKNLELSNFKFLKFEEIKIE